MKSYPPVLVSGRSKNINMGFKLKGEKNGIKANAFAVYNLCHFGVFIQILDSEIFLRLNNEIVTRSDSIHKKTVD